MKKIKIIAGIIILLNLSFIPNLLAQEDEESLGSLPYICNQYEGENQYLKMVEKNKSWKEAADKFHETINDFFNKQYNRLTEKSDQSDERKCAQISEDTENTNVFADYAFSTDERKEFNKKIQEETAKIQCALIIAARSDQKTSSSDPLRAFNSAKVNQEKILEEIEIIDKTVLATMDAFSEMQIAYVIHKELECVIENLNNVRKELGDYVKEMVEIPAKYINCGFSSR